MLRLGKRPARKGAVGLAFKNYFDPTEFPTPPLVFGKTSLVHDWLMLANDRVSNCLAEGTEVSGIDISGAFRIPYSGPVVTLLLASGKCLTVTPKHSVLTPEGFASADTIKKDDYLISTRRAQILPSAPANAREVHIDDRPTPIEEVFSAFSLAGGLTRKIMPLSVDFHGDEKLFNGDVEVVLSNRLLRHQIDATLSKPNAQNKVCSAGQLKGVLAGACSALQSCWGNLLAAQGNVGFGSYTPALAYAQFGISQTKRLSLSAKYMAGFNDGLFHEPAWDASMLAGIFERRSVDVQTDRLANISISALRGQPSNLAVRSAMPIAGLNHPTPDGVRTDPHLFGDLRDAFPGLIEADRVVSVDVQRYVRTHVYDLSTSLHWYIANGIVTHNCVWAGAAHETMLWVAEAGGLPAFFTDSEVISDYSAVTGYSDRDPDTDQGTDMQQAAAYRQKVGVLDARGKRHKIESYVAIEPGEVEQLALAVYLLGAVGVGIQFPNSAWDQFDHAEPWDVQPRSKLGGGHYVPCIGRNSRGNFLIVTWGRLHAVTPGFIERYMDEGVAYLSFEMLKDGKLSSRGFDADTLKADLNKLRRG